MLPITELSKLDRQITEYNRSYLDIWRVISHMGQSNTYIFSILVEGERVQRGARAISTVIFIIVNNAQQKLPHTYNIFKHILHPYIHMHACLYIHPSH